MSARVRPFDARRHMGFWQRVSHYLNASSSVPIWGMGGMVSGIFISLVLTNAEGIRAHPGVALAGLGVWTAALAVFREGLFWTGEQLESDKAVLWMLPLCADRIFWRQLWRWAVSGVWLLCEVWVFYAVLLGGRAGPPAGWVLALLFALPQAAFNLVLTALMVALKVRMNRAFMMVALAGVGLVFGLQPRVELLIGNLYCLINPFAWLNWVLLETVVRGKMQGWWLLAPVVAVSASFPFSLKSMQQLNQRGDFRAPLNEPAEGASVGRERADRLGEAQVSLRLGVLSGDVLWRLHGKKYGLVERLVLGVLSARERNVAELLQAGELTWTRCWFRLLGYLALFLAIGTLMRSGSLEELVLGFVNHRLGAGTEMFGSVGLFLLFCFMLSNVALMFAWNAWPERLLYSEGKKPRYQRTFRLYPASFWEAAKTLGKVNTMLLVLLLPLAVLVPLSPVWQLVLGQARGAVWFIPKSLVLVWGMTLFIVCINLVPKDPNPLKYWKSWLVSCAAFFALLALGMVFMATQGLVWSLCIGLCFMLAVGGWFFYSGWRYQHGVFQ